MVKQNQVIHCNGSIEDHDKHPLIYLKIPDNKDYVNCPYCGRKFLKCSN
jgi:uncharacterized Zn-finger protein